MTNRNALVELAERLTDHEKSLLLGECDGWGSWMFEAGEHLCSLGLGYTENGSIYFDTPPAKQMIAHLRSQEPSNQMEGGNANA